MMRVLVTGGAGFIGSHLCDALVNQGDSVVVVDNMSTGFWEPPGVELVRRDVTERFSDMGKFDRIFNLACPASPKAYQADPIKTFQTSVLGVMNALEYIEKYSPEARFLQASTSEIYGDPLEHPQRETYWGNVNPCGPRSCYDEGKRAAETLICDHQRCRGVDTRIARIFNTYGERMQPDDGRVVSNFVVQALKNEPITIYGDGSQTRSFCHVSDLVSGLMMLMESEVRTPVNLGNPEEFKICELSDMVKQMIPWSRSEIVYMPKPEDDPMVRKPDITIAQGSLGWTPSVKIAEGLEKTVRYFTSTIRTAKK